MSARTIIAALVALVATLAVGGLSQVPYEHEPAAHSVIRLAWRIRGAVATECRTLTAEELEKVPVHMRRAEECERRPVSYTLRVAVDGETVVEERVRAAGARADRPLYVFRDLAVSPGNRQLAISFIREAELEARSEGDKAVIPARLDFDQTLRLAPKQIALVTYDAERRALVMASPL